MAYATVPVRPVTKQRLDELRRQGRYGSLDEVVAAALDELETALSTAEVRRLARRGAAARRSILDEAERDSEGLEDTIKAVRRGMRKRFA